MPRGRGKLSQVGSDNPIFASKEPLADNPLVPGELAGLNFKSSFSPGIDDLTKGIDAHKAEEDKRSYLGKAFSSVSEYFHGSSKSLQSMEDMLTQAKLLEASGNTKDLAEMHAEIRQALQKDVESRDSAAAWSRHGAGFAKSVGLFLPGKAGYFATALTTAADAARPSDSGLRQGLDLALGAGKGAALKWGFDKVGNSQINLAGKAFLMSEGSKLSEIGLDSHTYFDSKTGERDITGGLWRTAKAVGDPAQIANDMIVFGAGYAAFSKLGINASFAKANPVLTQTMVGTTFGMSGGFFGELQRERASGQPLDMAALMKSTFIEGGLGGTAAAIGGYRQLQLQRNAEIQSKTETTPRNLEESLSRASREGGSGALPRQRDFIASEDVSGLIARLRENNSGALLRVREMLGQGKGAALGPERSLLVQHLESGTKLNPALAAKADLIACCSPELLGSGQARSKHIFSDGAGKQVTLEVPGSRSLRFTLDSLRDSVTGGGNLALALGGRDRNLQVGPDKPSTGGTSTVSELIRGLDKNHPVMLTREVDAMAKALEQFKEPAKKVIGGVTGLAIELQNGKILRVTDMDFNRTWGNRTLEIGGQRFRMDAKLDALRTVEVGEHVVSYYLQDKLQSPVSPKSLATFESLIKKDGKYSFWDNSQGQHQLGYEKRPDGSLGIVLLDYDAVRLKGQEPRYRESTRSLYD